jgi:predicted transcriptional regulator
LEATDKEIKLSMQSARVLKLLFKFRFVAARTLADVMGIRRYSLYEVLERLVSLGLIEKVYEEAWRIDRKPAYYYLNKSGVTTVRGLLDVKESVVHALYKNDSASPDLIEHFLVVLAAYAPLRLSLPKDSEMFAKTELSQFKQFPKNRPDLFVRTPDGHEAMIIFIHDIAPHQFNKKMDEIIQHSEDEGWNGEYPKIAYVLKNRTAKYNFLYKAAKKLDDMGIDEEDITIFATTLDDIMQGLYKSWASVYNPKNSTTLFE